MAEPRLKPARSLLTSPWTILVGLAALLCLSLVALFAVTRGRWAAAVDRELALIAAAGEPLTVADLEAFHALSPGERNVVDDWLAAIAEVKAAGGFRARSGLPIVDRPKGPFGNASLGDVLDAASNNWAAESDHFLAPLRPAMAKMQAALHSGTLHFPQEWAAHYNMLLNDEQEVRAAARLFQLEGLVAIAQGDAALFAQSLDVILKCGSALEREPVAVTQLIGMACDQAACELAAAALGRIEFSPEQARRMQEVFLAREYGSGIHRALVGHRAIGRLAYQAPDGARALHGEQGSAWLDPLWRLTATGDLALSLESQRQLIVSSQKPPDKAVAEIRSIVEEVNAKMDDTMFTRFQYVGASTGIRFTGDLVTIPEKLVTSAAHAVARNRSVAAALSLDQYVRSHGDLPASLEELKADSHWLNLVDPWSDEPLLWTQDGDEHAIYSVGLNGADDGGTETRAKGYPHGEPDVVVRFRLRMNREIGQSENQVD